MMEERIRTRGPGSTLGTKGANTRSALVRAAAELLEEGGMAAVTLRAVGQRSGVSRQAPYRHFADKEALLAAVAVDGFVRFGAAIAEAVERVREPYGRLEAMAGAYVRFALSAPECYGLMFSPELRGRDQPEVRGAALEVYESLVRAVTDAQRAGDLPAGDATGLAAVLWAGAHGVVDLTLAGHIEASKDLGDPAGLVLLLLTGLRPH